MWAAQAVSVLVAPVETAAAAAVVLVAPPRRLELPRQVRAPAGQPARVGLQLAAAQRRVR